MSVTYLQILKPHKPILLAYPKNLKGVYAKYSKNNKTQPVSFGV